ncbi:MAG: hypothetical protein ACREOR_01795 [Candidatus Binatia bacterium]
MTPSISIVGVAAPLVTIGGPVLLGLVGAIRNRRAETTAAAGNSVWSSNSSAKSI